MFTDPLAGVLDDAVDSGDATASAGTVGYSGGMLSWTGALQQGATVVISYSVTTAVDATGDGYRVAWSQGALRPEDTARAIGDGVLTNRVASTTVGSNCAPAGVDPGCATATTIAARTFSLTGLTPSFTVTGLPGSTVTTDGVPTMTVTTNSPSG